jgi:adenosylhomocysteine nucleosidase
MKKIGFVTGIEKEAIILQKIGHHTKSDIIWVGNKQGSAYTQANTLAKNGCEIIISFGFAGALDPQLSAGDLIIPKSVTDAEGNIYRTDYNLHQKLSSHFSNKFKVTVGELFGSTTIIWGADEKKRLFNRYNTKIVDMESLGVAQAAAENGCSFLIVRAISDTANQSLPKESLRSINLNNDIKIINILIDLAKNLNELPNLLRLAQNSRKAHICLRNVAKLGFGI